MTRVDDALLRRMVETIVGEVDPEQVILFGSQARTLREGEVLYERH